jgi:hypothetical protein
VWVLVLFLQVEETLSTLSYATRAKNIHNRPTVQYDPREAQISLLRRKIELLRQENSLLREQLRAGGAAAGAQSCVLLPLLSLSGCWWHSAEGIHWLWAAAAVSAAHVSSVPPAACMCCIIACNACSGWCFPMFSPVLQAQHITACQPHQMGRIWRSIWLEGPQVGRSSLHCCAYEDFSCHLLLLCIDLQICTINHLQQHKHAPSSVQPLV